MPHNKYFFSKEMYSFSYGVFLVKFAVYCTIKLRPTLIFQSASTYWLSHFYLLKMVPFIILTLRCQEDVLWTGLQYLKLFSIVMAGGQLSNVPNQQEYKVHHELAGSQGKTFILTKCHKCENPPATK